MEKNSLISNCGLFVIGGSAGSLDILLSMLPSLDRELPFPIIIVLHRKSNFDSSLENLFASKTHLTVKEAEDKDVLTPGCIYIAPADYHLLVENDYSLSLDFSEKVNYSRPSIDVTFETSAEAFGSRLVCLLLSGASSDGTEGLKAVKKYGGKVIVQNPSTAQVAYMPEHAIADVEVDQVIDAGDINIFVKSL